MGYEFVDLMVEIVLEKTLCPRELFHKGKGLYNSRMSVISRECSLYLTLDNSMQFLRYQALSGLGFNKLGLYEECIADPNNQFYLLQGNSELFSTQDSPDLSFMSGLCFNRKCSASDLEYAIAAFQEYAPQQPFISFERIATPSVIEQNYDVTTLVVLGLLSILLLLFLVCSVMDIAARRKKRGRIGRVIEIFSILTVIRLLESRSERNNERVKTFSGVKAFSLLGITLSSMGRIAYFAPTTSFYAQTQDESIYTYFYGMDIWLMTSGFFLSYILLKQHQKLQDNVVLLLKIVRRFLRLWPIYLVCLFINWNVLPLVGNGPLWFLLIDYPKKQCSSYISNIFMVSNLTSERCYNPLWLLELDYQLCFIFVPLLLLYLKGQTSKLARYAFYLVQLAFLISALGAGFNVEEDKVRSLTQYFFRTEYNGLNIMPFIRCGGFLIGYNLGIMYFQFKKTPNKKNFWLIRAFQHTLVRVGLPCLGVVGFLAVGISFQELNSAVLSRGHFLYFSILRTIVPGLVVLTILPSLMGFESGVKMVCESWVCSLISKLSLSILGIHYCISLYIVYCRQSDLELSNFTMIFLAHCTLLPSALLAVVLTSIIQIPVFVCKKIYSKTQRITYFEH